MKSPITVEVYRVDEKSGRIISNINKNFKDLSDFASFYAEAKERDGRNHIMVRNYDVNEVQEMCDIYDRVLMYSKSEPIFIKKMEIE